MLNYKKSQVQAFLVAMVFIVVFLLVYVVIIPIATPFIQVFNANPNNNAFNKFLFAALPFMVIIGGVIMSIRGQ